MFEYKWRHYKLITLIHKLIVVAVFTFGGGNSFALICALVASHSVFAIMSIYSRPYLNKGEDILAIVCLIVNVLNAVIALLVALGVDIPDFLSPIFITLNTVCPVAAIVLGLYFVYLEEKEEKKREAEKLARQMQAKLEQKERKMKAQGKEEKSSQDSDDSDSSSEKEIKSEIMAKAKAKVALRIKKVDLQLIDIMDQELDQRLLHILVNFFLFLGMLSFISLAVAALGVILAGSATNVLYPNLIQAPSSISVISSEFGGYTSWTDFVDHCCCQYALSTDAHGQVINASSLSTITETWKCILPPSINSTTGSRVLYKIRMRKFGGEDGTIIRPYCSKVFNTLFVKSLPRYNAESNLVSVDVARGVSNAIAQSLW